MSHYQKLREANVPSRRPVLPRLHLFLIGASLLGLGLGLGLPSEDAPAAADWWAGGQAIEPASATQSDMLLSEFPEGSPTPPPQRRHGMCLLRLTSPRPALPQQIPNIPAFP
jgi:hypothetical protein